MSKHGKDREQGTSQTPPHGSRERPAGRDSFAASSSSEKTAVSGARGSGPRGPRKSWLETHGRDLRFLGLFGLFIVLFYIWTLIPVVRDGLFPGYLRLNAIGAGVVLNVFGEQVETKGNVLVSPKFQVTIERGCDAIAPSALFCSAVLASPLPVLARLAAAVVGTLVLMIINFVRVVSLYYTGAYFRKAFDIMHLDVWQALFIFLAILFWALWAAWATRRHRVRRNATA